MTMTGGWATTGKLYQLKNRAWSKHFKVLVVWGGEQLGKIVEHIKEGNKNTILTCKYFFWGGAILSQYSQYDKT